MTPEAYLVLHNIQGRGNFGTLLRNACAFGVKTVLVVGEAKMKTFGNQGTLSHMTLLHFPSLLEAKEWLTDRSISLVGVEIVPEAKPIQSQAFSGSTAFMLGNEGTGMTEKQKSVCDKFVFIPQYGRGTASLNVAVAGSICLHHFGLWAGYSETAREGEKYVVEEPRSKLDAYQHPTEVEADAMEKKRAMRRQNHDWTVNI
ncbi:MAG: uncharacterized protein KVP18_003448 [Porospora cf. gigantea A]|uniref:uncharacterized protein n=1 Tax=Porospora cf. gigantea A TaxID=2853593 RepID=UPI00355ABD33|nr:MAG: hypothetical protein KVP18_003448 [Porospora cf. gigantea A]